MNAASEVRNLSKPAGVNAKHARPDAVAALEVRNLNKSFGGIHVTRDVTMTMAPGERRLIIGPNGAGKTTLFGLIGGELRPDSGSIRLFGQDITNLPVRARPKLGMARTYQIITLFSKDTLAHNVVLGLLALMDLRSNAFVNLKKRTDLHDRAVQLLASVGLEDRALQRVSDVSYGEQRRVELALALAQGPKLLLLDEPLAGLSLDERQVVKKLIDDVPRDTAILMIEHDMDVALEFAEQITVLHYGQVIVQGDRQTVVDDPKTREIYLGH
ncbi:ABC transporter ATP-binding protein [Noviherbaspirillum aerium]|uniref:ABC transporter ATP-binding protein n=1 Tax=Noviherbaspirillum aerium TaxID=2588497 RepID=UPI00124F72BE|nr:ABC transporter ATP-binding protein [Noviherbaspirillum aerium]